MYGNPFHLVLVFNHYSSYLMMFCYDLYVSITLETAALDTPNKVAVSVTDAPGKGAPTI
jgi:hypothetical protein